MSARVTATFWLFLTTALVGRSESAIPPHTTVAVQLKPNAEVSPAVLAEMKGELEALMASAGFRFEWLDSQNPSPANGADSLVVLELRGSCNPLAGPPDRLAADKEPLASTSVVDGHILPFTWVDCAALNRFLGSSLANAPGALWASVYGQSMARLAAHEFYHVLAQTSDHTGAGIAKASFSTTDLLATRIVFDHAAISRMRSKARSLMLSLRGPTLHVDP
jgi:hypothetical protein